MYNYGYGTGCCDPCGFGMPMYAPTYPAPAHGRGFALIVVLFILLIIVGAARFGA